METKGTKMTKKECEMTFDRFWKVYPKKVGKKQAKRTEKKTTIPHAKETKSITELDYYDKNNPCLIKLLDCLFNDKNITFKFDRSFKVKMGRKIGCNSVLIKTYIHALLETDILKIGENEMVSKEGLYSMILAENEYKQRNLLEKIKKQEKETMCSCGCGLVTDLGAKSISGHIHKIKNNYIEIEISSLTSFKKQLNSLGIPLKEAAEKIGYGMKECYLEWLFSEKNRERKTVNIKQYKPMMEYRINLTEKELRECNEKLRECNEKHSKKEPIVFSESSCLGTEKEPLKETVGKKLKDIFDSILFPALEKEIEKINDLKYPSKEIKEECIKSSGGKIEFLTRRSFNKNIDLFKEKTSLTKQKN